jgi:hypothetical protein
MRSLNRFNRHPPRGRDESRYRFARSAISLHCDAVAEIGPGAASLLGEAMNRSQLMRAVPRTRSERRSERLGVG